MKKFSVLFLLLMSVSASALAFDRDDRFSMNFGIGGYPAFEWAMYDSSVSSSSASNIISRLYTDYRGAVMSTGTVSGEFNWNICRWFNAAGNLGLCPVWNKVYDGMSGEAKGSRFAMCISIMPKAKVMWCNSPLVRVYSSLALGVSLLPGFNYDSFVTGAIQFNLVGMEIGRKWFGSFELGAGTLFTGAQVGFGFRF